MEGFPRRVTAIGALAEPVRRELYLYVVGQEHAVSRDEAASGVGVERHTAKFHLDRLVREGLLEADFRRLGSKQGPGAGRPTKLYRRSPTEVSVDLPARSYDLAGELLARAIDGSVRDGEPVLEALRRAASAEGSGAAARERDRSGPVDGRAGDPSSGSDPLEAAHRALTERGYEPQRRDDALILANCPFHSLARDHTELVCGMNLALIGALVSGLAGRLVARSDREPGRCCVVVTRQSRP